MYKTMPLSANSDQWETDLNLASCDGHWELVQVIHNPHSATPSETFVAIFKKKQD